MRNFAILETVYNEVAGKEQTISKRLRFRIIETYSTLDGPRSRIVNGGTETLNEALGMLTILQEKNLSDLEKDVDIMRETMLRARAG